MLNKKRIAAVALAGVLSGTAVITTLPVNAASNSTKTESQSSSSKSSSSSDSSGQSGQSGNQGQPPAKPGDSNSGSSSNQGQPPAKPGDSNGNGGQGGQGGSQGGGADTMTYDYSGTNSGKLTADGAEKTCEGETTESTEADVNAALAVNSGTLTIKKGILNKSGDDENGDNCNFYGLNSIALAVGEKSKMYVSDSTLSATSAGSNAIFSTDSATVYANNDTINTTKDNSRGLDATYSGTIIGNKLDISTKGDHSAALATDRGGGNISVANSTLKTEGSGSPLIYSTGNIQVKNVTGTASGSQLAGMEGLNTILIKDSKLTSTNEGTTGSDPVANGVIIYQSTSGDAESTTGEAATFQAVDSKLKSSVKDGAMFYITNTRANIYLKNTNLDFDSSSSKLLRIEGNNSNNWGSAGSNGGTVNFTADNETLEGDVSVDNISSLSFFLLNGSKYTGKMSVSENSNASTTSEDPITVNIDSDSSWVLTGDTEITNLNEEDGAKIVDSDGKTVTIKVNGEVKVKGDSSITLTVTGTYSTKVTTSDANKEDTDYIDRSGFDEMYGTSTGFTAASDKTSSSKAGTASSSKTQQKSSTGFFARILTFFASLFGKK